MSTLITTFLGCALGIVYGLSLIYQIGLIEEAPSLYTGLYSLLRIFGLLLIFYYLLHSGAIHFILLVISFFTALWATLFVYKKSQER